MKFTKEEAYKDLVAKLTSKGEKLNLSERTLNKHLDTLIKFVANEEMELSDFVKEVLPDIKELDGQYRKDNSDFIKQWEKDHPVQQPTNPQQTDPTKDEYTKKLEERLEALEAKERENEKSKMIAGKRKELLNAMRSKGIKDDDWSNSLLAEVSITEDIDVESKAESFLKMYNKQQAAFEGGATPQSSFGGSQDKDPLSNVKNFRKQMGLSGVQQ